MYHQKSHRIIESLGKWPYSFNTLLNNKKKTCKNYNFMKLSSSSVKKKVFVFFPLNNLMISKVYTTRFRILTGFNTGNTTTTITTITTISIKNSSG